MDEKIVPLLLKLGWTYTKSDYNQYLIHPQKNLLYVDNYSRYFLVTTKEEYAMVRKGEKLNYIQPLKIFKITKSHNLLENEKLLVDKWGVGAIYFG
jgi:hypothetical protein